MRRDPNRRLTLLRDEGGSAMIAVIGVMAVLALITVGVTASSVHSIGYTSATRAGVQSVAAADSGISYARAQLAAASLDTSCAPTFTAPLGSGVDFTVAVSYSVDASGNSFTAGCPGVNPVQRIKLTSLGEAAAPGVAGQSSGDQQNVEAIFAVDTSTSTVPGSGAAIYAYSASGFVGSGHLISVDGSKATVHIKEGNVSCTGAAGVPDSFVVENGSITVSNSCSVTGDVWARDGITVSGAVTVGGSAHASSLKLTGSAKVLGTAWITGGVDFAWSTSVQGRVTAKSIVSPNPSGNMPGGYNLIPTGPPAEVMPAVADWADFDYVPADWDGFAHLTLTDCSVAGLQTAINALAAGQGAIDARGCAGGLAIGGSSNVQLKNDVAIFANAYTLSNSGRFTSSDDHKLWLITPDAVADGVPSCPTGGKFEIKGAATIQNTIDLMIYTPCKVSITNSVTFHGQVFSGEAAISGAATMHFVPVGLPGVDLSTGESTVIGGTTGPTLGTLLSIRDA